MEKFSEKLPSRQEATTVLSVVVFIIFSWTLYRMFWYVPSWLEHLSIWSVATTAAYVLSFALLESIIVFVLVCSLSLVFPRRIFKQQFTAQACSIVAGLSVGAYLLQRKMKLIYRLSYLELLVYPVMILLCLVILILILYYIFKRFEYIARFIRLLAERMTVFLYVYVPLGLLGWLVVIFRNIR
jgi:hypothetical protein